MAVAVDATANSTSTSWNHTCSGADRVLLVCITHYDGTVTGVTYNSIAMSRGVRRIDGSGFTAEIWALAAPATGTHSVSVSASGMSGQSCGSISFTGADQLGIIGATNSANGTGASSLNLTTSTNGSYVVDAMYNNNTNAWTLGAGQTQIFQANITSERGLGSYESAPTAGAVTMSWSGGTESGTVHVAAEVLVAGTTKEKTPASWFM